MFVYHVHFRNEKNGNIELTKIRLTKKGALNLLERLSKESGFTSGRIEKFNRIDNRKIEFYDYPMF